MSYIHCSHATSYLCCFYNSPYSMRVIKGSTVFFPHGSFHAVQTSAHSLKNVWTFRRCSGEVSGGLNAKWVSGDLDAACRNMLSSKQLTNVAIVKSVIVAGGAGAELWMHSISLGSGSGRRMWCACVLRLLKCSPAWICMFVSVLGCACEMNECFAWVYVSIQAETYNALVMKLSETCMCLPASVIYLSMRSGECETGQGLLFFSFSGITYQDE